MAIYSSGSGWYPSARVRKEMALVSLVEITAQTSSLALAD